MAQKKTRATFRVSKVFVELTQDLKRERGIHNSDPTWHRRFADVIGSGAESSCHHLYIHIPFCARICPYCAFYKDQLDRSQTQRFCEAILREIEQLASRFEIVPQTIFFG